MDPYLTYTELTCTCSKLTIETLEQGVNMFKVNKKDTRTTIFAISEIIASTTGDKKQCNFCLQI